MKTYKLLVLGLAATGLGFTVGCGETVDPDVDTETHEKPDSGDSGGNYTIDLSECANYPGTLCKDRMEAGDALGCVAAFDDLQTNQAGNSEMGYSGGMGDPYVGFYAYNDQSTSGVMIPEVDNEGVRAAWPIESCGGGSGNYALYMKAEGWVNWGAGLGMDWGGPNNPSCDEPGAAECLKIGQDNPKFALETAAADPACQGGDVDAKLDCLKRGKVIKEPKDISAYRGIGFWIMKTDANIAGAMKVTFPIPATVRFYGGDTGCTDDDGVADHACFNDYFKRVPLPADPFKWEYVEILFSEISWDPSWGLQLDTLGYKANQFPAEESMGLKFQIDSPYNEETFPNTEMYIDDITLLPIVK